MTINLSTSDKELIKISFNIFLLTSLDCWTSQHLWNVHIVVEMSWSYVGDCFMKTVENTSLSLRWVASMW